MNGQQLRTARGDRLEKLGDARTQQLEIVRQGAGGRTVAARRQIAASPLCNPSRLRIKREQRLNRFIATGQLLRAFDAPIP